MNFIVWKVDFATLRSKISPNCQEGKLEAKCWKYRVLKKKKKNSDYVLILQLPALVHCAQKAVFLLFKCYFLIVVYNGLMGRH